MDELPALFDDDNLQQYVPIAVGIVGVILVVVVAIILFKIVCWLVRAIVLRVHKSQVKQQYGVEVPDFIVVKRSESEQSIGSFRLRYPRWLARKRDGNHDGRSKDWTVIEPESVLRLGRWEFVGKNPFAFYDFVNDFRAHGVTIGYCREEQHKRQLNARRKQSRRNANSIDNIIAQFQQQPTDFEKFCADLFRALGYRNAQVTPPVRDGGFDILLTEASGIRTIVECKCYARNHHIGRPVIQKLQGANAVTRAEKMMVVTTSSFTPDATTYGAQVGVQLTDGNLLVQLCQRAWGAFLPDSVIPEMPVYLTRADLLMQLPADLRGRY